jgi:predicted MFS family arabinose efflux permease
MSDLPEDRTAMPPGAPQEAAGIGSGLVTLLAVASGVSVANIYYAQPLLPNLAASLGSTASAVGYVPMLTQIGYAVGLFVFIPLGDVLERKRLILALVAASAAALLAVAAAPGLPALAAASFAVGLTTVVPHVALPLAAHLAPASERGRVIGTVMSGVLVGILLARTVSGFVGQALGWRAMFVLAAGLMVALGAGLRALLPRSEPTASLRYLALLGSLLSLTRAHRDLREAALIAAAGFAAFSVFWTTLAFFLAGPPHFSGSGVAGLFGLVGASGALAAPLVGRFSDRRGPRFTMGVALVIALASFAVFAAAGDRIWGLVLGVTLLDLGWQSAHVANLARVQALDPAARSRLNTVYMVTLFAGGACGTWAGAHAWNAWGWRGACAAGALFVAIALGVWAAGARGGSLAGRRARSAAGRPS